MNEQDGRTNLVNLAASIVCAYVGNNEVPSAGLPALIADAYSALHNSRTGNITAKPELLEPAVNPKKSVFADYIICLEDGKKYRSLKRHLQAHYAMSPDEYRKKWGLAADYPMVAPNYSRARSALAKKLGLGQGRPRKR